jgi:two-component system, chemotaxis family, chemotaxis protein CheY
MINILIIDDSVTVRESLEFVLTNEGFNVEQAANGQEGLEKFKKNRNYSLVIVDWNMPIMNGLEFLKKVRKISRDIPIILLTSISDKDKIEKAKMYKANAWIIKPFVEKDLIKVIRMIIDSKQKNS